MTPDEVVVVEIASVCAALVAVVGALVLRAVRHRSLALSVIVVALVGVGAVVAGALGTAKAMFLSPHDFSVLLLVTGVSGTVALLSALALGRGLVRRGKDLAGAAGRLGSGDYMPVGRVMPYELAQVDAALTDAGTQLAAARARERSLSESRRQLVAGMSHDLRTPLAGIRAMAEALEDGVVTGADDVRRYHQGLRREADRMTAMVEDLFEVARIDAHSLQLDLRPLDVAELVSDALASASPVARTAGVQLDARLPVGLPRLRGSEPELGRVLRNLLGNAVRHTPAGGSVCVQARSDVVAVSVLVTDGCGGIPDQDVPRVFDLGFRGSAARTPADPEDGSSGAGLGLTIARGLVEAQQGELTVHNTGGGCCFAVVLPVAGP